MTPYRGFTSGWTSLGISVPWGPSALAPKMKLPGAATTNGQSCFLTGGNNTMSIRVVSWEKKEIS